MKSLMMSAALVIRLATSVAACLVVTTGALAADEPAEATGPKVITVDALAQARFGVSVATLKGVAARPERRLRRACWIRAPCSSWIVSWRRRRRRSLLHGPRPCGPGSYSPKIEQCQPVSWRLRARRNRRICSVSTPLTGSSHSSGAAGLPTCRLIAARSCSTNWPVPRRSW